MLKRLLLTSLLASLTLPASAFEAAERAQFADGMYARGLYDLAVEEYLGVVREGEGFEQMDVVFYRLGECYRHLGDAASADQFYQRLARDFPDSAYAGKAVLRRAERQLAMSQYREATRLLSTLLGGGRAAEVRAPALYYLGFARKQQYEANPETGAALGPGAEQAFQELLKKYPDSPFASFGALELAAMLTARDAKSGDIAPLYQRVIEHPATDRVAAEALFQQGELAYRSGDFEQAAKAYGRLLESHPADRRADEARLQAGWSYYHTGQTEKALALVAEEAGADALYLRANAQRQLGKSKRALATYDRLLKLEPEGSYAAAAAYEKALVSFQGGDFEQAVRDAESMGGSKVSEEDRHWLLAESFASLKRTEQAAAAYRAIAENFPDGTKAPVAAYRLAALLQEQGKLAEASKAYRAMQSRYPKHELAPDALFASAYCQAIRKEHAEALTDWTALVKNYPDYTKGEEALYQKALTEVQLGQNKEAKSSLRKLVKTHAEGDKRAEAHRLLGVLYDQEGKLPSAEKNLRAALTLSPPPELAAKVRFRLATVLQKKGEMAQAAALLNDVLAAPGPDMPAPMLEWLARYDLEHGPVVAAVQAAERLAGQSTEPAWRQIGWALAGQAYARQDQAGPAKKAYRKALDEPAQTAEGARAALALGQLTLDAGNSEAAAAYFARAGELARDPQLVDLRARSYYGLGRAAEEGNNWAEAARYFMSVAVLFDDPGLTPECLYRAAGAFEQQGRVVEREKALVELEARYPESAWFKKSGPTTKEKKP